MLTHVFIAERCLKRGIDRELLPSFRHLFRETVWTSAIQDLQTDLDTEAVAELMLSRYSNGTSFELRICRSSE